MPDASPSAGRSVPKVLIAVGGEEITHDLMVMLLENGFAVATASTGEQALDLLGGGEFDVLILDLILPGVGGIEVLQETRRRGLTVHVILISSHIGVFDEKRFKQLGANDVLPKPLNLCAVLEICQRACGLPVVSPLAG